MKLIDSRPPTFAFRTSPLWTPNNGLAMLGEIIAELPLEVCDRACEQILKGVRSNLVKDGVERQEYLILTLHALESAWQEQGSIPREEVF